MIKNGRFPVSQWLTPVLFGFIVFGVHLSAEQSEKTVLLFPRGSERCKTLFRDGYYKEEFGIVGRAEELLVVIKRAEKMARSKMRVLIEGETGSGKELIARLLHARSPRRDKPFVVVDSTQLQGDLAGSKLFGHVKGAFTGAYKTTPGDFEVANGGTIFLDEIGELPLELQAKLLRVLQDGKFERVGESREVPRETDVRIIAATNRDLARMVREGKFREDLYYRLKTLSIALPPLRVRKEDIPLLADHIMKSLFERNEIREILPISKEAFLKLKEHSWPGNVRELESVITEAAIMCDGKEISASDIKLPTDLKKETHDGFPVEETKRESVMPPGVEDTGVHDLSLMSPKNVSEKKEIGSGREDARTGKGWSDFFGSFITKLEEYRSSASQAGPGERVVKGDKTAIGTEVFTEKKSCFNPDLKEEVARKLFYREYLSKQLSLAGGAKKGAAERIGIAYPNLFQKIRKCGLKENPEISTDSNLPGGLQFKDAEAYFMKNFVLARVKELPQSLSRREETGDTLKNTVFSHKLKEKEARKLFMREFIKGHIGGSDSYADAARRMGIQYPLLMKFLKTYDLRKNTNITSSSDLPSLMRFEIAWQYFMKNFIGVHLEKTGGDREKAALSTGLSKWQMNQWWQAIRDKTDGPSILRKGGREKKSKEHKISSINEKKGVKEVRRKRPYILKVNTKVAKKLKAFEKKDLKEILLAIRTAEGNIGGARGLYNAGKEEEHVLTKKEFQKRISLYGISFRKKKTVNSKP